MYSIEVFLIPPVHRSNVENSTLKTHMKDGMHCQSDRLDELTMGRIALKLLIRGMAKNNEIPTLEYRRREIPNVANEIGEKTPDVQEFIRCILPSIVGRVVGSQHVSMDEWIPLDKSTK